MKFIVLGALLALADQVEAINRYQPQGVTFLPRESEVVQLRGDDEYPAYMHGFGGYHTYMRDIPDRFETESDDRLMHSMYNQYATEGKKDGKPDGNFWLDEASAKRAALEVVATHLHLKGKAADAYLASTFDPLWKRFDVNEEGKIEIDRAPVFLRQICGNAEACIGLQ